MASQAELDQFLTKVSQPAELEADYDKVPCVEAPRSIIEHFLRSPAEIKNFDSSVGFFMFQGVKVYEEGKRRAKPADGVQP